MWQLVEMVEVPVVQRCGQVGLDPIPRSSAYVLGNQPPAHLVLPMQLLPPHHLAPRVLSLTEASRVSNALVGAQHHRLTLKRAACPYHASYARTPAR